MICVLLRPLIPQQPCKGYLEGFGTFQWVALEQPLGRVVRVRFGQTAGP